MEPMTALLAFSVAATLPTIAPGLDTALALRTAAVEGGRPAVSGGAGIAVGSFVSGAAMAIGLSALPAVSEVGYLAPKIVGGVTRALDGATVGVLTAFGVKVALDRRAG